MTLSGRPWAVSGGEIIDAGLGRLLAYAAMGSDQGVILPADFVVRAQTVPTGSVQISGGAYAALGAFSGQSHETYIGQGSATPVVTVPTNTGGTLRQDYLFIRVVNDWQWPGEDEPADHAAGPYDEFYYMTDQPAGRTRVEDFSLPFPAVLLAGIRVPAATSTITGAMITDLRTVARPRVDQQLRAFSLTVGQEDVLDNTVEESFPNNAFTVDVPRWASYARMVFMWGQVRVPAASTSAGKLWGRLRLPDDSVHVDTQFSSYDGDGTGGISREAFIVGDDVSIPVALRGKTCQLFGFGNKTSGTGAVSMDSVSSFVVQINFYERAVDNS